MQEETMKVLHIEITKMNWKGKRSDGVSYKHLFRIRQGDINGQISCHGITKAELMREISDWVDEL